MKPSRRVLATFFAVLALLTTPGKSVADSARVAVASNFTATAESLEAVFESSSGYEVQLIPGSTGKHYAQILHGAPFDAFLAADSERPARLERDGLVVAGSRFTYARGGLVLWSPDPERIDGTGAVLLRGSFRNLAIANPMLAPYGRAAREVLKDLGVWEGLQDRLVRGENIAQAFHFVHSGTAELGFVAASQLIGAGGSRWDVPPDRFEAIDQQAVLLTWSPAARAFLEFVRSEAGRDLIRAGGYDTP